MALFKPTIKAILKAIANLSEDEKAELLASLEDDTEESAPEAADAPAESAEAADGVEGAEENPAEPSEDTPGEDAEKAPTESAEGTEESSEGDPESSAEGENPPESAEDAAEKEDRAEVTLEALAARLAALEEKLADKENDDKSFGTGAGFSAEGKNVKDMSYEELKRQMIESGDIVRK